MSIELTGAQIVGFLAFCLLVGPALLVVGGLIVRVRHLERSCDDNNDDHKRMWKVLDEVRQFVSYLRGRTNGGVES